MIEVTIKEIINGIETMDGLMQEALPSRAAYQVAKIAKAMSDEYKFFEEARLKLIKKYGKKDESGELIVDEKNQYTVPKENMDEFTKEFNELTTSKVELLINPIDLDSLYCDLTPTQMMNLMPFIIDHND